MGELATSGGGAGAGARRAWNPASGALLAAAETGDGAADPAGCNEIDAAVNAGKGGGASVNN